MKTHTSSESGVALIAVLCLIFSAGMLTTAVVAMSKYNSFTVGAHVALQRSFYINEGVANRVQFLIAADRSLYPYSDELGEIEYADYEGGRYVADGTTHQLDYYGVPVEFIITDTRSGVDLSSQGFRQTLNTLRQEDVFDTDLGETLRIFTARIGDYNDAGDEVAVDGMETAEYDALGMFPLPRNAAMQFREELLYIPDISEFFPTDRFGRPSLIRLIPPAGTVSLSGAPSLFTADRRILRSYCRLDEEDADAVMTALEEFRRDGGIFSDKIDPTINERLRVLSRQESGNYTVTVGAPAEGGRPSRRLTFSYEGFNRQGPTGNTVRYLEWMFH